MKQLYILIFWAICHSWGFTQDAAISIQSPSMVSKGVITSAAFPTILLPANQAYLWTVSDPNDASTSIVQLTGLTNTPKVTFKGLSPGRFKLNCKYGANSPVSKIIEILPDPNLTIVAPNFITIGNSVVTASITEPTGGCPNLRYEWLGSQGVEFISGENSNTLTFKVLPSVLGTIQLSANVTTPAGKIFTATSKSINVSWAPESTISLRSASNNTVGKSIVTVGDTGLNASVPYPKSPLGSKFLWTITGGVITSGQGTFSIQFSAPTVGNVSLTCLVTNPAGQSVLSTPVILEVVPDPISSFSCPSSVDLGIPSVAMAVPQQRVTYYWQVGQSFGNSALYEDGVHPSGQGTPIIKFVRTVKESGCNISLIVTNAAGKSSRTEKSISSVAISDVNLSFGPEAVFTIVQGGRYTATAKDAPTCQTEFKWSVTQVVGGQEVVDHPAGGATIELAIVGDMYSRVTVGCVAIPITCSTGKPGPAISCSGSRVIVPPADATILGPDKVTIGIPFKFHSRGPQNRITNFSITTSNGNNYSKSSISDAEVEFSISPYSGCPPGLQTVRAESVAATAADTNKGADSKTKVFELLAPPTIKSLSVPATYRKFPDTSNRPNTYFVSRGSIAKITPVFSDGTGTITAIGAGPTAGIGAVQSGQVYDTASIFDEVTYQLLVTNPAGATATKTITFIPVAPELEIRFITINQGVERYLNAQDQQLGTFNNSTFPQDFWQAQAWKRDVPLIAGRPARFTVHLKATGSIPFGSAPTAKNKLTLVLTNSGGSTKEFQLNTASLTAPTIGTSFGETNVTKVAQFDVMDPTLLTDQTSFQIKVTLDPSLGIDPVLGIQNRFQNATPLELRYMPKMEVHLVSIDYSYSKSGVPTTVGMTNAELNAFAGRIGLLESIKALYPVSYINATREPMVVVQANPLGISAGWNEADPSASTYVPPPGNSTPRGPLFVTGNSNYTTNISIMRNEFQSPPYLGDPTNGQSRPEYGNSMGSDYSKQNNTYVLGVVRSIQNHTRPVPSATPVDFTTGVGERGQHWAWTMADIDENGNPVADVHAATTAIHELGHANGAAHAPIGAWTNVDPIWGYYLPGDTETPPARPAVPLSLILAYGFGGIGGPGVFFGGPLPWKPSPISNSDNDLMSYAADSTRWISDYNFTVIYRQQKDIADFVSVVTPYTR